MRIGKLPFRICDRIITYFVTFPLFVPLEHRVEKVYILFVALVHAKDKLTVDLIYVEPVGLFQIEKGMHKPDHCLVFVGSDGMRVYLQDLGKKLDSFIRRISLARLILGNTDVCGLLRITESYAYFFQGLSTELTYFLDALSDCHGNTSCLNRHSVDEKSIPSLLRIVNKN